MTSNATSVQMSLDQVTCPLPRPRRRVSVDHHQQPQQQQRLQEQHEQLHYLLQQQQQKNSQETDHEWNRIRNSRLDESTSRSPSTKNTKSTNGEHTRHMDSGRRRTSIKQQQQQRHKQDDAPVVVALTPGATSTTTPTTSTNSTRYYPSSHPHRPPTPPGFGTGSLLSSSSSNKNNNNQQLPQPILRDPWNQQLRPQEQSPDKVSDHHQQQPSLHFSFLETLEEHLDLVPSITSGPRRTSMYQMEDDFNSGTDTDEENGLLHDFSISMVDFHAPRMERVRSRSVCDPISSEQTPVGSPRHSSSSVMRQQSEMVSSEVRTPSKQISRLEVLPDMDGTIITPPPLRSRSNYGVRRRHNSCVAPNTKEFHTLATIFGWVTVTADDTWPTNPGRTATDQALDAQYEGGSHLAAESGDESDMDDTTSQCETHMNWTSSQSSSSARHADISPPSPFGDSTDSYHSASSSHDNGYVQQQGSSQFYGEELTQTIHPFYLTEHETRSRGRRRNSERLFINPKSEYNGEQAPFSPFRAFDSTEISPWQSIESSNFSEHSDPIKNAGADMSPTGCLYPSSRITPRRVSLGNVLRPMVTESHSTHQRHSPVVRSPNIHLDGTMLPTSCTYGKDPRHLSISHQFSHPNPAQSDYISTAPLPEINPLEVSEKKRASTKTDRIPSPEATPTALDAPPIPPPFLEIDARVFDITEEAEENCSIVYGQQTEQITDSVSGGNESRPIVAGSIVKVIEKLTHQYGLDNGFMTDFFLTYRLFMSPVQLCKYLIQRYLWALEQDTESRCVVRVRTFAVLRHWIKTHFADDFLTSKSLRFQMALFLNEMRFNAKVQGSTRDARIIKSLMELFKAQRRHYKALAEESLAAEKTLEPNPRASNDAKSSPKEEKTDDSVHPLQFHDPESEVAVESLDVARIWREAEVTVVKSTKSDISDSMSSATPIKARLRASTMAGPLAPATDGSQPSNSKRGKDARVPPMTRQTSDGTFVERERRLSASSIKSARSSTWSAKMTLGIHKLRQKSEDMFQQLVNPTNAQTKSYSRQCVCWTPTFTGIADHPALNTARSHPILRSTVAAQGVFSQEATATAGLSNVGVGSGHHPSNKSIKRLKSSLTLGSSNNSSSISGTATSPNRSPTLAQFSNLTSRHSRSHSRSNSNTSVGYHPNPNCPFHIPCMESIQSNDHPHPGSASLPSSRLSKESTYVHDDNSKLSVHEFLEMENQPPPVPPLPSSIPPSPAWPYSPWSIHSDNHHDSHPSSVTTVPAYKPFILYYRSQAIAQQLCLLEQHFLEQVNWEEFLELELTKAGRKKRSKSQSSISGYLFKTEYQRSGIDASNERSNKLCMWVASEVVSTQPIEDRVRVIEKFIRIAQKCYQYRNYNSLIQLVMGLGSSHLCGLRRTWSRVGSYEMHVLQDLQDFISPCGNWNVLRKAMNRVNENEPEVEIRGGQRSSLQAALDSAGLTSSLAPSGSYVSGLEYPQGHFSGEGDTLGHSKYLQHQTPFDQQGCIPFLGLFVFDLTHIAVSPSWFLPPQVSSSTLSHELNAVESGVTNRMQEGTVSRGPRCVSRQNPGLVAASPNDLPNLLSTGTLLVHFHKFQLIAKTLKWFLAFQRRPRKYTFTVDPILYSKCFLLRVLKEERLRELAESCEID